MSNVTKINETLKEKLESIMTIHESADSNHKLGECGYDEMLGKIYDSNSDLNDPDRVKVLKYAIGLVNATYVEVGLPSRRKLINKEVWNATTNEDNETRDDRLSDRELITELVMLKELMSNETKS